MLVTWPYHLRGSIIETFDPRARWISSFLILGATMQFWDVRFILFFFALVLIQYALCKLTFEETKVAWAFLIVLVVFAIGANTLITGAGGAGVIQHLEPHIVWQKTWEIPLVGWELQPTITSEKIALAGSQMVRMLTLAILFLVVPYTMNPRLNGVAFAGMGMGYKIAFSLDLAFRFVPTLARNFVITLDAQKARGYELGGVKGGLVKTIRRVAPLLVPVVMNAIVGAEDIINSMELRSFGVAKRTWIDELHYRKRDYYLMGFAALCLVAALVLRHVFGFGEIWVPDFLVALGEAQS